MALEEQQRSEWRLLAAPPRRTLSTTGPFYVVHLYSGRRRHDDFQAMVEAIISDFPDLGVRVLSVDTAVNDVFNVHDPKLWHFLLDVAMAGRMLGLLLGPPCETWTSARHHQQLDEHGHAVRGPRPLRAASELWGMAHLTISELAQVYTGNCLLLKGLLLPCVTTFNGGATFLEHPAVPYDETFPSIWRTGLIKLLLRFPHGPFRKITIEQWKYRGPKCQTHNPPVLQR